MLNVTEKRVKGFSARNGSRESENVLHNKPERLACIAQPSSILPAQRQLEALCNGVGVALFSHIIFIKLGVGKFGLRIID